MIDMVVRNWQELIKPRGISVDNETLTDSYGKFTCEPLEPGYGITLGNSLRRVLLSSLQGVAATAVKIDGLLHEFHSVHDAVEDATDIVLNVKGLVFQASHARPYMAFLKKSGPGAVCAGDIQLPDGLRVVNKDHLIATLDGPGPFSMEFMINPGRGYVSAERNKVQGMPIGTIPIDSLFSPVRKVNYSISNARVGQITDYDSLSLEIWTNGSVKPSDALAYAAKIIKDQLSVFVTFEETEEVTSVVHSFRSEQPFNERLFRSVDELELSVRSANCLQNAGIMLIGHLVQRTEQEMLKTKNFGRKSLKEIKEILSTMNLSFGMKIDAWDQLLERWKLLQGQS